MKKIVKKTPKIKKTVSTIYLFGVLYSLVKRSGRIYLKLHFSFNMSMRVPESVRIYTLKKRLILFGDTRYIKELSQNIMSLRLPNVYSGIGLRDRYGRFAIKAGKIRKR